MLSLEKNFLFVHAPKTGGTSIKNVLKKYQTHAVPGAHHSLFFEELKDKSWQDLHEHYDEQITSGNKEVIDMLKTLPSPIKDPDEYISYNETLKSYLSSDFHLSYTQWKELIHPTIFDNLIKFGVARNPYDRVVSIHLWQNNGVFDRDILIKKLKVYAYIVFNEFNPCVYYYSDAMQTKLEDNDERLKSVKELSSSVNVDSFIDLKPGINFFLKYETQMNQTTIDALCDYLKVERSELLHLNKNARKKEEKHYSLYYDDELCDLVTELYSTDLETFDYKFEDKR